MTKILASDHKVTCYVQVTGRDLSFLDSVLNLGSKLRKVELPVMPLSEIELVKQAFNKQQATTGGEQATLSEWGAIKKRWKGKSGATIKCKDMPKFMQFYNDYYTKSYKPKMDAAKKQLNQPDPSKITVNVADDQLQPLPRATAPRST